MFLLSACQPLPMPTITTDEKSAVDVRVEADQFILDIHSETGIGTAQVETNGVDAERLTLRLHLAGLEQFRFAYDDVEIMTSVSSHGDGAIWQAVRVGDADVQPIDEKSPYWLDISAWTAAGEQTTTIPNPDGYFEITAPLDFAEHETEHFSISWIDFYR